VQTADAAQETPQVLAINVFHGEERRSIHLADIANAADVGVRDLTCDANFGAEAFERLWIRIRREEFESYRLAEREIVGAVDFTHSALAEESDDPVALSEHRTGRESGFVKGAGRRGVLACCIDTVGA
jgi:hypothetical protein